MDDGRNWAELPGDAWRQKVDALLQEVSSDDVLGLSALLATAIDGTSVDGAATLESAACVGRCDGAPVVVIDEEVRLNVAASDLSALADDARGRA